MKRFITELGFDEIAAAFVTRPLRVPAVVLRSANDDAPAVAVVPGFGKVGTRHDGPAGDALDVGAPLDVYELGRVLDVTAAEARVRLVNHPTELRVPRERLSLPFPSWQQLAYGFEKGSPP